MQHTIYVYDNEEYKDTNINFLSYIKRNINIIKEMGVKITVKMLDSNDLEDDEIVDMLNKKNITVFPIMITNNKIYKGLKEVIGIYDSNINEYKKFIINKIQQSANINTQAPINNQIPIIQQNINHNPPVINRPQPQQNIPINSRPSLPHINQKANIRNKHNDNDNDSDDDNESVFGESDNMMDSYRTMVEKRSSNSKNVRNSNMRSIETMNKNEDISSSIEDRSDNIYNKMEPLNTISINPETIEKTTDSDPQDDLMEKAYWSRISESD